jgi:hypothetical protein
MDGCWGEGEDVSSMTSWFVSHIGKDEGFSWKVLKEDQIWEEIIHFFWRTEFEIPLQHLKGGLSGQFVCMCM